MTVLDFVLLYTECFEGDVQIISNTSELLTSNKTGRVMSPKCPHKMIAKHLAGQKTLIVAETQ